jgi:hypothetical protein
MTSYLVTVADFTFSIPDDAILPPAYYALLQKVCASHIWQDRALITTSESQAVLNVSIEFERILRVYVNDEDEDNDNFPFPRQLLVHYQPSHISFTLYGGDIYAGSDHIVDETRRVSNSPFFRLPSTIGTSHTLVKTTP